MKHRNSIFCLLPALLLSLISCSEKIDKEKLDKLADIEAMGDSCPERAIIRLDSIRPQFGNENEYMRNKLAMLDIRLHDKAFITHTSDSTIKEVCSYFEKHGTAKELQETYYYMGSVYRDLKDYPRAVTFFLKAIEVTEKNGDVDLAILEVSCLQLSTLYREQYIFTEALTIALKGLKIAELNGTADERTYMNIANSYFKVGDVANTIIFCYKTVELIEKNGINKNNADLIANAMSLFAKLGHGNDAEHCYNMLNKIKEDERPHNYLGSVSSYYEECISIDSAAVVEHKIFETTDKINYIYNSAKSLTIYYANKGDYENATKYAIYFIRANNTIIKDRDTENTDKAKNIYQYQRDKEEELKIIENAANNRLQLIVGISASAIIVIFVFAIYIYRKKQLINLILKGNNKINSIKQHIKQKEEELKSLMHKNAELSKELDNAKSTSRMLIEQNCELTRQVIMSDLSKDSGDIITKFKSTSKGQHRFSDEEWKELLCAIDKRYPEFTLEVQEKFKKISEPMLRVCYLWKIKCSNPEISNLTGYPPQTVWDRVKRIEKVMGVQIGSIKEHS